MASSIYSVPSDDRDLREFLIAVFAVEAFLFLFFWQCKVYDLSTAMFSAVLLGTVARRKFAIYHALFPLACVNRETAFLLIVIFAVYFFRTLPFRSWLLQVGYQCLVFLAIRLALIRLFADSPGLPFWFRPVENLKMYVESPWGSLMFLVGACLAIWLSARRWRQMPRLLKVAVVVMVPILSMLYLLFGYTFEFRAFAEVYPVAWLLVLSPYLNWS